MNSTQRINAIVIFSFVLHINFIYSQTNKNPTLWPFGGEKNINRKDHRMQTTPLDFSKAIFENANFHTFSDFSYANFFTKANFKESHFNRQAWFRETKFDRVAWFWGAVFDSLAYFSNATFNSWSDFGNAKFKHRTYFQGTYFDSLAYFFNTSFDSSVTFGNTKFNDYADFSNARFSYYTYFVKTQFNGFVDFRDAHFYNYVDFSRAKFNNDSNFYNSTFDNSVNFESCLFKGKANYKLVNFFDRSIFLGVEFKNEVDFERAKFNSIVDFNKAIFYNSANFKEVSFDSIVYFKNVEFRKSINFIGTNFSIVYFDKAKIFGNLLLGSVNNPKLDFRRAIFSKQGKLVLYDLINLIIQSEKLLHISFYDSLSYHYKRLIFDNLKNESFKNDKKAQFILSYIFSKSTMYQIESDKYEKFSWYNPIRLGRFFYFITMGLGYKPFRLIWWILFIVVSYTFFFIIKMPDRIKSYISKEEKNIASNRSIDNDSKFLDLVDKTINCFYFSLMIFFSIRLKKDILIFFNKKEKAFIISEWILGFIIYIAFITLSKAGSIFHQLKNIIG